MKKRPPIAVVGMAGLFPGAADLNIFWQNIINKVDSTVDVPRNRWIASPELMHEPRPAPDKAFSKRACLISTDILKSVQSNLKGFDIDENLLKDLDPLYHIVLHTGRSALSSVGTSTLNKERTGVILAAIALPTDASSKITREILGRSFEEKLYIDSNRHIDRNKYNLLTRRQCLSAKVTGLPAAILAQSLGLGGGSFTLDAACASSLYAVKLACDQLQLRRTDMMLAGGVSRPECLYTQIGFSQLMALSPSGRCAPFDESADGLVVGEGAGILVLKRLEDALQADDTIYGVIRGIGISNDMRSNLLAPDSEGQIRAMRSAYASAGWSPADVDLVECHGTGTPIGDQTEINSLKSFWKECDCHEKPCAIGSVKSMIGHLLTAAGAAGMIKTLLALNFKLLPPSLHFKKAPPKSALNDSPFRVQTEATEWIRKTDNLPLRAAVSAFGFGGTNGHLLFEEWYPKRKKIQSLSSGIQRPKPTVEHAFKDNPSLSSNHNQAEKQVPIAIVGMEAVFGSLSSLRDFQETVFKGDTTIGKRPRDRWKGCEDIARRYMESPNLSGGFMNQIVLQIDEFHIPPNEIPDILPQHLLMLKVAAKAMQDAGLPLRKERPRMGVIIGMGYDFEANNFHLRWNLHNHIEVWKKKFSLDLDKNETAAWLTTLQDACSPPLTATRTLGALGGLIASRIAREFRFGGPSFVVSGEETSGLKALEIGVRSLQQNEVDTVLIGAIDLVGDIRNIIAFNQFRSFSKQNEIRPFDHSADGTLPGEGAAALIIKRLDQAQKDGDRIYAIIKGIGNASGGSIKTPFPSKDVYMLSLRRCIDEAAISPASISYFETHGSADSLEDSVEETALYEFFTDQFNSKQQACAVGSVKPNIGHTGAAAGIASIIKTSLCLYQEIIPPLKNFKRPKSDIWQKGRFHIPAYPQYWLRDRKNGPRRSCVGSMTSDGNCMHVILEDVDYSPTHPISKKVARERQKPLGFNSGGLFVVEGNSKNALIEGLTALERHTGEHYTTGKNIEFCAHNWHLKHPLNHEKKYALSIVADNFEKLQKWTIDAKNIVLSDTSKKMNGAGGISYCSEVQEYHGKIAFVFPGSGNHYVGMGRGIGIQWPEILRKMDAETLQLKTQLLPHCYTPWRVNWEPGWEIEAHSEIIADPLNMIFGQVAHGGVVANLVRNFDLKPSAVIGYSLGESAGLFAMGAWPDRGEMLQRMLATDLFHTQLSGPCLAARKIWDVPASEDVNWCVAAVNRAANIVHRVINKFSTTGLLIVNTPHECVIGGRKHEVEAAIKELGCEAVFLEGVVTVHCKAAMPIAESYKNLHIFPTTVPEGIQFYSCALCKTYELNSQNAASSILRQALYGFDFTAVIKQAYEDGIRIFLEMGPHASCTRMISKILYSKPHIAVSACVRGEDDYLTTLKFLGSLIAARVPVNLTQIYGKNAYPLEIIHKPEEKIGLKVTVYIGGKAPVFTLPQKTTQIANSHHRQDSKTQIKVLEPKSNNPRSKIKPQDTIQQPNAFLEILNSLDQNIEATSEAHQSFLKFSTDLTQSFAKTFALQNQLLETIIGNQDIEPIVSEPEPKPVFGRDMCLEFAVGSVAKVLGPEFAVVDTYAVRVRLPDEPLMLVDRILTVEGEKGSLGSGRVVTEHDVLPGSWYLDADRAPVCISVEAGQADLFLCAYLGIDLAVKGKRTYRLLDATVKFHRGLPRPGDTIRYEIQIEKFIRQGNTYLFFFHFEGHIGNSHLITMRNGCAGFFTPEEVRNSGGIILTEEDTRPLISRKPSERPDLVPMSIESYSDEAIEALRHGNLAQCFGELFEGIKLADSLRLPGGRMKLIDRILSLDPTGGRYGLGIIRAEADIHPDDWFLTCHFMDDPVMPGTLMYECCNHTLRVFIQRMGWVTDKPGVCYEPLEEVASKLKCRGPVTPDTRHVVYEVELKEIGYQPEPYAIADAHMYADDHRIVLFKDMTIKMTGVTREEIESLWTRKRQNQTPKKSAPKEVMFDRNKLLAFAVGKPSEAFGEPYKIFDGNRFVARLPGPPYLFIDRITHIEPKPWVLKPGGWIEAEYDVPPNAWYFYANRTSSLPFCMLLEIAFQPCGWLAAYLGSSLKSQEDLQFRNLGGNSVLYHEVLPNAGTLRMLTRMNQVSEAGNMIIEQFDMKVLQADKIIYKGNTTFGFFSRKTMAQQVGLREADRHVYVPDSEELKTGSSYTFTDESPLLPEEPFGKPVFKQEHTLAMPSKALRMIDRIEIYAPDGGPEGLGFIRGVKMVDPDEWFFKAHFYQDPVCPGSLGIESFMQLIKFMALKRWKHLTNSHRFAVMTQQPHHWIFRGQIIPTSKKIEVEAVVTQIQQDPVPAITASGYLKVDGLYIYKMENFGLCLVPLTQS
ncbi:MAG: hypothetical protein JW786_10625 [Desulfobacterales bacterium]|nr:hypothetical protein [Desulfobacterales bacterium]